MNFGRAELGDKTMVDVLVPFDDALTAAVLVDQSMAEAWRHAALVAEQAAAAPPTCCRGWAGPDHTPRRASAPPTPVPTR